jgi:uncharacterized protein (DUF4415 family)
MVSYTHETMPPVSREDWDRVAAIKDEDIDCSDIPDLRTLSLRPRIPTPDWGEPRLAKVAVTCELDADVAAWLKQAGTEFQTRLNSILRQAMAGAQ